jgi:DNA invertase Pin-like site-specific DNA recombinase
VRSYVRESSPRQAEVDRYGPDLQRKGIIAFYERWGIPHPEKEYFDAATGRHVYRRHGLQQALEEANSYDALLMFHSSRSFRNRHDAAVWKTNFRQAGVVVVFTEQGFASGDPRCKVVEGFNEIMDELYADTQGMFISKGLRQKFERGGVNGLPPLGYSRYHRLPGDPKNGSLIIDD